MGLTIIEALLKLGMFVFKFFGAKEENYKWMVESLDTIQKKKRERSRYILESEESQIDELNQEWDNEK